MGVYCGSSLQEFTMGGYHRNLLWEVTTGGYRRRFNANDLIGCGGDT